MSIHKDKNGSWYAMVRYDDWDGKRKQKCKRGFVTKREAQDWERRFLLQQNGDLDMLFKDFYKLYEENGFASKNLYDMEKETLAHRFPEMRRLMDECKFSNCTHLHEPHCAIKKAVEENVIADWRYSDYCNMMED